MKITKIHNIFKPVDSEVEEQHEVIHFEIDELPQAALHKIDSNKPAWKSTSTKIFDYGSSPTFASSEESK